MWVSTSMAIQHSQRPPKQSATGGGAGTGAMSLKVSWLAFGVIRLRFFPGVGRTSGTTNLPGMGLHLREPPRTLRKEIRVARAGR